MDSFANSDRQYSDGQNNREPIPEEIQAYGLKPPVRLPDGSIELGDYLAANHLNYILNDLYKKLASARVVTERGGNSTAGYEKFSDGTIEMWGEGAPNASTGDASVSYPIQLPGVTTDVQITQRIGAGDNTYGQTVTSIRDGSYSATGFSSRTASRAAAGGSAGVASASGFRWRAVYHPPVAGA